MGCVEAARHTRRSAPSPSPSPQPSRRWDAWRRRGTPWNEARRVALPGAEASKQAHALLWLECVLGTPLLPDADAAAADASSVHAALRSGEVLCDLVNVLKPGIVARVTRAARCDGMSAMRLAAKQRDNVTNYLEACKFLGLGAHDTFMTVDLF